MTNAACVDARSIASSALFGRPGLGPTHGETVVVVGGTFVAGATIVGGEVVVGGGATAAQIKAGEGAALTGPIIVKIQAKLAELQRHLEYVKGDIKERLATGETTHWPAVSARVAQIQAEIEALRKLLSESSPN